MVQTLVQNHLCLRGDTYYFRYVLPAHIKGRCPNLPIEIKRSLRTDSYSTALALACQKLPLIKLIRDCHNVESIEKLFSDISDFNPKQQYERSPCHNKEVLGDAPTLSEAWSDFSNWKSWSGKQGAANQRMFDNLVFFIGNVPVNEVTKADIRDALNGISKLPRRNKKAYKLATLAELLMMSVPSEDAISSKYVKEHLKLCQSLFSRYLKYEVDALIKSPTEGLKYECTTKRYASLTDVQIKEVLAKSQNKPEWFKWFMLISVYSGARRSELIGLNKSDFKYCTESNRNYFHIRKGKTNAATRIIPLHQRLIDEGLLDWLGSRNEEPLFNVLPNRVTELFNTLLEREENHVGERMVLHSLRHTFITKARSVGISNVLVQQVVGHEKTGAGQTDRYTHTFHLKDILTVVDSVDFN